MPFQKINIQNFNINPFTAIGKDWMLITAAHQQKVNTMTASWGGMGVLWNQNVVTIYVRPQRYTKEFIDAQDYFSLSFFDDHHKELNYLGTVSGRDIDKINEAQLHVTYLHQVPAFEEAKLVFIVQKIYQGSILPTGFIDDSLDQKNYPQKDYHIMYIGKIIDIYQKV